MADLEKAHERIQTICEKIRTETIQPAKEHAQEIIEQAKKEAEEIKKNARYEASKIIENVKQEIEEEKQIFNSSLEAAAKKTVESLKQKIENSLFNPALEKWTLNEFGSKEEQIKLIQVIIQAIEKDGLKGDLSIYIPKNFSPDEIVAKLSKNILERLKSQPIPVDDIKAGVKVQLENQHMTLAVTDTIVKEIVASFVRKDFRKNFFST